MSVALWRDRALQAYQNGYTRMVRLVPGDKIPAEKGWNDRVPAIEEVRQWLDAGAGIGLRMTVLDIDVEDEAVTRALLAGFRDDVLFGPAIPARIGRPPKIALYFRSTQPFTKRTIHVAKVDGSARGMIELLGERQQIATYNVHPKTGKEFFFLDESTPHTVPYESLFVIEESDLPYITDLIRRNLPAGWAIVPNANGVTAAAWTPPADPAAKFAEGDRHNGLRYFSMKLAKDFTSRTTFAAAIHRMNRERCDPWLPLPEVNNLINSAWEKKEAEAAKTAALLPPVLPAPLHDEARAQLGLPAAARDDEDVPGDEEDDDDDAVVRPLLQTYSQLSANVMTAALGSVATLPSGQLFSYHEGSGVWHSGEQPLIWRIGNHLSAMNGQIAPALKNRPQLVSSLVKNVCEDHRNSQPTNSWLTDEHPFSGQTVATPAGVYLMREPHVLHPHRPEYRHIAATNINPVFGQPPETFLDVLAHITENPDLDAEENKRRQRLLMLFVGSIVFPTASDHQRALVFDGAPKAGKTSFARSIARAMGSLGTIVPSFPLFLPGRRSSGSSRMSMEHARFYHSLVGPQLLLVEETPNNSHLNNDLFKLITDRTPVTARAIFGAEYRGRVEGRLVITTNLLDFSADEAILRRLLRFSVQPRETPDDPHLERKLRQETPQILGWMLECGWMTAQHGLSDADVPMSVQYESREEIQTEDALLSIIAEVIEFTDDLEQWVPLPEFHARCEAAGLRREEFSKKAVTQRLLQVNHPYFRMRNCYDRAHGRLRGARFKNDTLTVRII